MHGRLRVKTTKEQEEETRIKEREKAYHFKHLTDKLFELRPNISTADDIKEALKLSGELLLINPDFYTVWNIRKEVLLQQVKQLLDDESRETQPNAQQATSQVPDPTGQEPTKSGDIPPLDQVSRENFPKQRNEKSYSVWQHRIWCLSNMPKSEYDTEILLCNTFLDKDERNFHCWDYRSYICDLAQADLEREFKFTTEKIKSNFSNFSAWHRRHKLLIRGLTLADDCPRGCDLKLIWPDEYNMILNALFTDPSDQSPWLYHNWLVKNNFGHLKQEQLENLKTLEEMEPDNKWVKQAIKLSVNYLTC